MKKTRDIARPYAIFTNAHGWEWRVLKAYKSAKGESKDSFARWFCAVRSPLTGGGYDWGDVYIQDILSNGKLEYASDEYRNRA